MPSRAVIGAAGLIVTPTAPRCLVQFRHRERDIERVVAVHAGQGEHPGGAGDFRGDPLEACERGTGQTGGGGGLCDVALARENVGDRRAHCQARRAIHSSAFKPVSERRGPT